LGSAGLGAMASAGGEHQLQLPSMATILAALLAMSLCYVAGMFLNDAFDADIDARERPERPIPSGQVTRRLVYTVGFSLLVISILLVELTAVAAGYARALPAGLFATALAFCIVLYNAWHKNNPVSPLIMGLCRVLVYLTTAAVISTAFAPAVLLAALALLCYLIGLTAIAKQENLNEVGHLWPLLLLFLPILFWQWRGPWNWLTIGYSLALLAWTARACFLLAARKPGNIPKAVSGMLAGISLVDGLALAALALVHAGGDSSLMSTLDLFWIGACAFCFVLTLLLQRIVPGT